MDTQKEIIRRLAANKAVGYKVKNTDATGGNKNTVGLLFIARSWDVEFITENEAIAGDIISVDDNNIVEKLKEINVKAGGNLVFTDQTDEFDNVGAKVIEEAIVNANTFDASSNAFANRQSFAMKLKQGR